MKLEEAFEKYDDSIRMKRPSSFSAYDIKWLKGLHAWGNQESRDMGFWIPQFMIDDANAEDWKIVE